MQHTLTLSSVGVNNQRWQVQNAKDKRENKKKVKHIYINDLIPTKEQLLFNFERENVFSET